MKFKETKTVEFKKSTTELRKALEDLCSFVNADLNTFNIGIMVP